MGSGRYNLGGNGTQTDALAMGGAVSPSSAQVLAEGYDGTNWSTRPALGTANYRGTGSNGASASLGITVGGISDNDATQEFTGDTTAATAKTVDLD